MLTGKDYCDKDLSATLMKMGFMGFGYFYYEKDSSKLKATHQSLTVRTAKALGHTLAISLYEAQKWLREEKNIDISITISPFEYFATIREFVFWNGKYSFVTPPTYPNGAKTYEEALLEGIKEAVKILEKK